ncbi:hypothetical protein [Methylomonas sp. MgM2]
MSSILKCNASLSSHNGIRDSGSLSNILARLLSVLPMRRLQKLADKSPAIDQMENLIPSIGGQSNKQARAVVAVSEANNPRQVFAFPNKGCRSASLSPPSIGQAKRLRNNLRANIGAPFAQINKISASEMQEKHFSIGTSYG